MFTIPYSSRRPVAGMPWWGSPVKVPYVGRRVAT